MSIQIATNSHTLQLEPRIREITKSFLTTFGFSYFQYLRCFADGSIGLLTNDTNLIKHFQQVDNSPVVFSSFETTHKNSHSYWFLWDEALPKSPVQLAREKFHIHHGITLVRRNKHYYDMIAIALAHSQSNPGSFYLNKLKAIEQFINEFDLNHRDLIRVMDSNPIVLPESYRDINYQKICLSQGRIQVHGKNALTYVTTQELACLRLLCQGFPYKRIAQMLNISVRTVETYLRRVKQRTDFSTQAEVEKLINSYLTT